jgi:hypothetical protein
MPMSGFQKQPDIHPTFFGQNPTFGAFEGRERENPPTVARFQGGGEVFALDIPFYRTEKLKVRNRSAEPLGMKFELVTLRLTAPSGFFRPKWPERRRRIADFAPSQPNFSRSP